MSSKKKVLRGGQKVLGTLSSGTGDDILTRDATTKETGIVPPIDPSIYLSTSLLNGKIFVGNSSNLASAVTPTGAILIDNIGLFSIAPDVITNENIFSGAAIDYSKLNLSNSLVNNDISTNANITRTKIATGTPYKILINNSTGIFTEQVAITPNRVLVSDANGLPIDSSLTTTILSYVDPTSSIQNQLNNRLTLSSTITPVEGDLVAFQSGIWNRFPKGTSGQYLTSTVGGLAWTTTPNGLPIGGGANEVLRKIDSTDYNTEWHTLSISDLTDITASAAQINVLNTGYYDATSSVQTQLNQKLNSSLAHNAIFVGNSSDVPAQLAGGSNGQVLSIVGGSPQWQTITGTGTVTSVAFSGGTTGLTVTGSPITTSGTITLTGTLGIANGGTNIITYTTGDILYSSASNILSKLAIGTTGQVLAVSSGGIIEWINNVPSSPLTTKGDIYVYSTTNDRLLVGTDGYHLTADSTEPTGLKWTAPIFNPFSDLNPLIMDNTDNTKLAKFEASNITTGTTRTYTLSDYNGTIALLGATNGVALSKVDDTNITLTLSAGSGTALLNATTITAGWNGTLADGRIASSSNWNTAYNRSGTSLGFTSSTFTFTKQDTSTLTVSVPTFNQNTTGSAATLTTARTIGIITGDATSVGSSFDGSANNTNTLTFATVNSNTGSFGSATQVGSFTVNGKGLITAASNITITPAVGSITGLGTGVATWLATPSWTNFNSAITGTAPYWALTGTSTLTGVTTITSNTALQHIFNGTWTATANTQNHVEWTGTITARNTASDILRYLVIDPTLISTAATQTLNAVLINPTFTDSNSATKYILRIQNAASDRVTIGFDGATIITSGNSSTNPTLSLIGIGTGTNNTLRTFQSDGTTETFSVKDNGNALFTAAASTGTPGVGFQFNPGAHTALTASTEVVNFRVQTVNQQWNTGALTTQRSVYFRSPTYRFVGASTLTNAYNVYIDPPVTGTNATFTNTYALGTNGDLDVTGQVHVSNTFSGTGLTISCSNSSGDALYSAGGGSYRHKFATGGTVRLTMDDNTSAFVHQVTITRATNATTTVLTVNQPTNITAYTVETNTILVNNGSPLFSGTIATQRHVWIKGPVLQGGTLTDAYGLYVDPYTVSSGTITNSWALGVNGHMKILDGFNIATGTTTGTILAITASQKLGIWGASPIVQPTTGIAAATRVGGGGTTLTDTDTFDGYTIKQVVKALRNLGALA